jgi:hypothetical protein
MAQSLLCFRDLRHGRHRLRQASGCQQVQASGTLPHSRIQVSLLTPPPPTTGPGLLAIADAMGSFTWRAGATTHWIASMDDTTSTYFLATHGKTSLCKFDLNIEDLLCFIS